jgi:hypothetical protein
MKAGSQIGRGAWLIVLLALVVAGCRREIDTVPAGGSVMFNGAPVQGADVGFLREAGRGPAAIGVTDAAGRFQLKTGKYDGAVPGKYAVTVQKDTSSSMKIPDPLPEGMTKSMYMRANNLIPRPLLPQKYSNFQETPLHLEVSSDYAKNQFELKLEGTVPNIETPRTPSRSIDR